ncbi:MAG TPA: hypothetical protein VFI60_07005 [Candidatus Acidoferrum sp.]|nr:hypothetical protein [Candidatus Acidoferrum sp.]
MTRVEHSCFPLFSQNGAANPSLQIRAGEQVAKDSTDSQQSSQQQGLFLHSTQETLAEILGVVNLCFGFAGVPAKVISTVAWMDGLYTFQKSE